MPRGKSKSFRTFALVLTAVTIVAAVPIAVHHHADHGDDYVHLEHDHGGHGGLLEQGEASVPAPHAPVAITTVALRIPYVDRSTVTRPASEDFLSPLERAPPTDLPRAPPTSS